MNGLAMRALALCCLLFACTIAAASDAREFAPGEKVEIKPGHGLLAIDVTSDGSILSIEFNEARSMFGATKVTALGIGRNIRLIELPAAQYRWSRVNLFFQYFLRVRNDPRFHFTVVPGEITYAGELTVRSNGQQSYGLSVVNQSAQMMVDIDRAFPGIRTKFAMQYRNAFPDRYMQFAGKELDGMLAIDALKAGDTRQVTTSSANVDARLKQLIDELFAPATIGDLRINPSGDLVAESEFRDDKYRLKILDPITGLNTEIYEGKAHVSRMIWAGVARCCSKSTRPKTAATSCTSTSSQRRPRRLRSTGSPGAAALSARSAQAVKPFMCTPPTVAYTSIASTRSGRNSVSAISKTTAVSTRV